MDALQLASELRRRAESYYGRDLKRAAAYARWILILGRHTGDESITGLGLMTQGDVLHFRGIYADAWVTLETASQHFLRAGDAVGWSRTWLGRLNLGFQLPDRMSEIETYLPQVIAAIESTQSPDLLVRLANNLGLFRTRLGQYEEGMTWLTSGYERAAAMDHPLLPNLCNQLGTAYERRGELSKAKQFYEQAQDSFGQRQQQRFAGLVAMNIALIEMRWGRYETALKRMQDALLVLDSSGTANTLVHMALCWLNLGEYVEALRLVEDAMTQFGPEAVTFDSAFARLVKAEACTELARFADAEAALNEAGAVFETLGSGLWTVSKDFRRAQLAFRRGDDVSAQHLVRAVLSTAIPSPYIQQNALLLSGQLALREGHLDQALAETWHSLMLSRRADPRGSHEAHALLGTVRMAQGDPMRAARHYYAAVLGIDKIQRELGRNARRGFLGRNQKSHTSLMRVLLMQDRREEAFAVLERLKAELFMRAFRDPFQQRIFIQDQNVRTLYEAREEARQKLTEMLPQSFTTKSTEVPPENLPERLGLQRRIRHLTQQIERIELEPNSGTAHAITPEVIQVAMAPDSHLVEYYTDGEHIWIFSLSRSTFQCIPLEASYSSLLTALDELWQSITGAVAAGVKNNHPARRQRTQNAAVQIGRILFQQLAEQIAPSIQRLVIVPFGALHYLPFALLSVGGKLLTERFELVVNPSASLLLRNTPASAPQSLCMACATGGLLAVRHEIEQVSAILGSAALYDTQANRVALGTEPLGVLHIGAHARHDSLVPAASFIQLSDGPLYADDLVRFAPPCELVTLSGCETGRVLPATGDDVIGIGAEFLRIGASALLTSLWKADDDLTVAFMIRFYESLVTGQSKSGALRDAQRTMMMQYPDLHPAFWAGFQLSGNPRPLQR